MCKYIFLTIWLCILHIDLAAVLSAMNIAGFSQRTLFNHNHVILQTYEDPNSVDNYMLFILELFTTH